MAQTHTNRRFIDQAFAAGAAAYLDKDRAYQRLIDTVRTLAAGGTVHSSRP